MAKTLKTHWYSKTIDALQLAGMSESTQESYARAVRMLIEHFEKDPRQITEEELQSYFLYRRNETRWSPSTLKICYVPGNSFSSTSCDETGTSSRS